jgi:hypothetical protein
MMTISRGLSGAVPAVLCAAVVWASATDAHAGPSGVRRARLEVDTTGSGDAEAVLERRLEERAAVVLRDAGILPREQPDDPVLRVTVTEVGGDDPGYRFGVIVEGGEGWSHEDTCELCTETELVKSIEATLQQAVPHIPGTADQKQETAPPKEPPPPRATPAPSDRAPLGKLGKAGIGVMVPGMIVLGVGIGLAAVNPKVKSGMPLEKTTTRPAGFALIAVGAAATVTGVILLAVDRRKARRTTAFAPTLLPRGIGLAARASF